MEVRRHMMDKTRFSRPLDLKTVQITDGFWHTT